MHGLSVVLLSLAVSASGGEPFQGVLLEFSSIRCGPCQQMSPIVSRLERQGYPIRKIDVDRDASLARRFRITSIPAFVLVVQGREVTRCVGLQSESTLKRLMARIPRAEPKQESLASTNTPPERPEAPSGGWSGAPGRPAEGAATAPNVTTQQRPKRGILPRFPLPLFGSNKTENSSPASVGNEPPVIRANNERPRESAGGGRPVDPLAASTRIRIKDATGMNYGSGTIIDSRRGRTIVLTCGHIFRELKPESTIEVDVLDGSEFERYVGEVLRYDLEADVGLIAIPTDVPLPAVKIAPAEYRVSIDDPVYSIGCGGGEFPSKESIRVTALNRYLGPDNIECTGVPEQGRSGGSLFSADGAVIGVCIAADPRDERGLFAGLSAIHDLLDLAELSHLYGGRASIAQSEGNPETSGPTAPSALLAASKSRELADLPSSTATAVATSDRSRSPADVRLAATRSPPSGAGKPTGIGGESVPHTGSVRDTALAGTDPVAVAAQDSRGLAVVPDDSQEAEVICIIRPLDKPRSASRVVIINRVSPKFLAYLRGELQQQPQPTTARRIGPVSRDAKSSERSAAPGTAGETAFPPESSAPPEARDGWQTARGGRTTIPEYAQPLRASSAPQRYRRSAASRQMSAGR